MIDTGFISAPGQLAEDQAEAKVVTIGRNDGAEAPAKAGQHFRQCPKCGQASVIRQEGCDTCVSCDYSKCG
jgi:ribonucleoside-diphosphate reductase alpha chain